MSKKRNYPPRVPGTLCPHCLTRSIAYDSCQIDPLTREIRFVCQNADCGHTFVAQLAIYRTVRPSLIPNPDVRLPLGQWRSRPKPANDDQPDPANENGDAPSEDIAAAPG